MGNNRLRNEEFLNQLSPCRPTSEMLFFGLVSKIIFRQHRPSATFVTDMVTPLRLTTYRSRGEETGAQLASELLQVRTQGFRVAHDGVIQLTGATAGLQASPIMVPGGKPHGLSFLLALGHTGGMAKIRGATHCSGRTNFSATAIWWMIGTTVVRIGLSHPR
jgi:hypothetical protein